MGEVAYFIVNMLLQDTKLHCKLQRRINLAEVQSRLLAAIFPALHVILPGYELPRDCLVVDATIDPAPSLVIVLWTSAFFVGVNKDEEKGQTRSENVPS